MPFEFRDEQINEYMSRGYAIFRAIIPPALLTDLRREADKARAMAIETRGPTAQRLQPIDKFADRINQKPFQDYCELPDLVDAVSRLLGRPTTPGHRHIMGILVEPREPWHCGWHRDGLVEIPVEGQDDQFRQDLWACSQNPFAWNQVNCALYADSCTWYVPGSHLRWREMPGEVQTPHSTTQPEKYAGMTHEARELALLELCRTFPGAVQVHLGPGDYMIYRNNAWHCGNYIPYQPRATIHDVAAVKPREGENFWKNWGEAKNNARARMELRKSAAQTVSI